MLITKERAVFINSDFTVDMSGQLVVRIFELSASVDNPIFVVINSFGGSVQGLRNIISALECSRCKIITINIGVAYSCGALLFASGHERWMLKGSKLLFHEVAIELKGPTDIYQIKRAIIDLEDDRNFAHSIIQKSIGMNRDCYDHKVKKRDWTLSSEEALDEGIATKIITKF